MSRYNNNFNNIINNQTFFNLNINILLIVTFNIFVANIKNITTTNVNNNKTNKINI